MGNTLNAAVLLLVPLMPLVGSLIAGLLGTSFGRNVIGRRTSHGATIFGVLVAFLLSALTLKQVLVDGGRFNQTIYEWMMVGTLKMEIGFMVDALTAIMMCVITFVSLMVHVYTIGYMRDDPGYNRFFAYISLFTFSMLMLVMSNNLLQIFFGWEAVGLVSYLLIGFWFERPTAIFANLKAFMVNRVGDLGFILGIGLIAAYAGTLNYKDIFGQAQNLSTLYLPGTDWKLITVICICLFIGAMGKSAQFPLHVWLPDSMEGPTPISALIHAATMVTAGIFMVARMSPLFELSNTALSFIIVIGAITALFMGLLGIIQNDIKRVVAYSTLSQLGYMTVALGASAYSVAVFHLMTHAFFKALLFLAAGSVIIGVHHNQDMRWMGGLRKYMPITHLTLLLGTLALVGTPFFSGFYSKDAIIEATHSSRLWGAGFAYVSVLVGVFITALYSFRLYFMVFWGDERYGLNPNAHAHEEEPSKPKESPAIVLVPLVLLAIPSVLIGFFTLMPLLFGSLFQDAISIDTARHVAMSELATHIRNPVAMALHGFFSLPFCLAVAGAIVAWFMYVQESAAKAARQFFMRIGVFQVLEHKYFIDWFNENIIAKGARLLGRSLWTAGDRSLIDGLFVDGSWKLTACISAGVRRLQTGCLYHYIMAMIFGVLIFMTYFVWFSR